MSIRDIFKQAEKFVTDNSPTLLTSIGVAGTVGTAVLTGQASFAAAGVIRSHEEMLAYVQKDVNDTRRIYSLDEINAEFDPLDVKDKAKLVWKLYIPPVVVGSCTIGAIVFANRIGTRRAAAIAAAYSVSEKAFSEYKEKVVEVIGDKKEEKLRGEIAQDQVNANPVADRSVIVVNGDVLCMEAHTGRYFTSDYAALRKAENDLREQVLNDGFASLGDLYYLLSLPRTPSCEEVGWSSDTSPKLDISSCIAEDGRPCLVVTYSVEPIRDYRRFH